MTEARGILQHLSEASAEHDVSDALSKCILSLKAWTDKLEKRQQLLNEKRQDFEGLLGYTEQLSVELEKSKPNSSVSTNVQESLKKAVHRLTKSLKEMSELFGALEEDLAPSEKLEHALLSVEEHREHGTQTFDHFREVLKTLELPVGERRAKKKSDREKRPSSPKRLAA